MDACLLTTYHYKLETKVHVFKTNEVFISFGNAGAKTIFEMTNERQRNSLELVHHPGKFLFINHFSSNYFYFVFLFRSIFFVIIGTSLKSEKKKYLPRSTYPTPDPIGSCKIRPSDKIR